MKTFMHTAWYFKFDKKYYLHLEVYVLKFFSEESNIKWRLPLISFGSLVVFVVWLLVNSFMESFKIIENVRTLCSKNDLRQVAMTNNVKLNSMKIPIWHWLWSMSCRCMEARCRIDQLLSSTHTRGWLSSHEEYQVASVCGFMFFFTSCTPCLHPSLLIVFHLSFDCYLISFNCLDQSHKLLCYFSILNKSFRNKQDWYC